MRIAIYTSDLTQENRHLLPWRMVLEIGNAACAAGQPTTILAGRPDPTASHWAYGACPVEEIAKPYSARAMDALQSICGREKFDVLFWPVAWRSAPRLGDLHRRTSIPIVWYIPGACYRLRQAMRAVPHVGVRSSAPFLFQSIYPKGHLLRKLRGPDARFMITASEFTRTAARQAGWPADDVFAVPPGKPADRASVNGEEPVVFNAVKSRLAGMPFYLFLGPPTEIRGIRQLLWAFNRLAGRRRDVHLVCLFRSDPGAEVGRIHKVVENSPHAGRIVCVWRSVGKADLGAFLDACHAVVLPFLLVPSEIPLAVIEAAGHRKPVITTGPGGTADFVQAFGLAVPSGNGKALAQAMQRLLDDALLYDEKCAAARRIYAAHPTWDQVTRSWLGIAERAINRQSPLVN